MLSIITLIQGLFSINEVQADTSWKVKKHFQEVFKEIRRSADAK
jgi:hypothetical protein